MLKECDSQWVVRYFGCFAKARMLWICMEYCDGGSLQRVGEIVCQQIAWVASPRRLGIGRVLIPPRAGVASALGVVVCDGAPSPALHRRRCQWRRPRLTFGSICCTRRAVARRRPRLDLLSGT